MERIHEWIKKMARREMGRYWSPKEKWKISTLWKTEGKKRAYPKCVPLAKATRMSSGQKASAVKRKRAVSNTGPKPTNVATFSKRDRKAIGGII